MGLNKYVYPHPINAFLIGHLEIPVQQFCELYGHKQPTLSSWISRDKAVESLPISFIYSLSLISNMTMDEVYAELLDHQTNYHQSLSKGKRTKKYL